MGTSLLALSTYTPDGTLIAEITGSTDFQTLAQEFSCAASGNSTLVPYQNDVRGWTCFDVASVSTIGVALATGTPIFGHSCAPSVVGDGVITIEDVLLVLLAHYQIAPYNVALTTPTITAPLTDASHAARCATGDRAPVTSCENVYASDVDGSRRRALDAAEPWYELALARGTSRGMWVHLSVRAPSQLVTGNVYIDGLPSTTRVVMSRFEAEHVGYEGGDPIVLYDTNHTRTLVSMANDDYMTISYNIFSSLPFGRPEIYVWVPRAELCVKPGSTLTRIHDNPSRAEHIWTSGECVRVAAPPPPPGAPPVAAGPSPSPGPSPLAPAPAPADPPPSTPAASSGGLGGGAVAGIAVAALACCACAAVALHRRGRRKQEADARTRRGRAAHRGARRAPGGVGGVAPRVVATQGVPRRGAPVPSAQRVEFAGVRRGRAMETRQNRV